MPGQPTARRLIYAAQRIDLPDRPYRVVYHHTLQSRAVRHSPFVAPVDASVWRAKCIYAEFPNASVSNQYLVPTSPLRKEKDECMSDNGLDQASGIEMLTRLSKQLGELDEEQRKQESIAERLERRIKDGEMAHGQLLQQSSAIMLAIEKRRAMIQNDKNSKEQLHVAQAAIKRKMEELRRSIVQIGTHLQ